MTATTATANQNEAAHALIDKAADKIHKIVNNAGDEIEETKDAIAQRLQINPVASFILALGAGVVLDRLVRVNRSEKNDAATHLPELLLGLTAVGETAINQLFYRRLFADTAKIAAMTIFGALLAGIGAMGGLYALYLMLLGYGISAQAAMLTICGGAFALAVIVMAIAGRLIRKLHQVTSWLPMALNIRKLAKKFVKEFKSLL